MDGAPGTMETMSDRELVSGGGKLRCAECATGHDPERLTVDRAIRFEGASDPGDEAVLFALTACLCWSDGISCWPLFEIRDRC